MFIPHTMKPRNILLNLLFLAISVVVLYGAIISSHTIEYIFKPLIMIWIGIYFLLNTAKAKNRWTVPFAMSLSLLGDILLMFAWKNELWFFAGVGAFLFSQLAYVMAFRTYGLQPGNGYLLKKPVYILPFLGYLVGMFLLILPGLEGIMIPIVFIYAVTLTGMSMAAFNRFRRMPSTSFIILFIGSILFLISDSLLAINKFLTEIPMSGFWVMITYIAAQYMIMRGLIRKEEGERIKGKG
jgi:uncharacterized membrane protein YhhN